MEGIVWSIEKEGTLHVRNYLDNYTAQVALDNIGMPLVFDSKEALEKYVDRELELGNVRKGSYILTLRGA